MLRNKNILLISPEAWGQNFVSKHHYAIELAKRSNLVYFLNPPSSEWSVIPKHDNLQVVNYQPKYRGLSRLPGLLSALLTKNEVAHLEKFCNISFDIIWNFDSSRFFNLKLLASKIRISHIVDFSEDKNTKPLNTTADLCLCTTKYLLQRQKKYNVNSFNIGHGYANYTDHTHLDLTLINKSIKVGYVGNLLIKYLDWELIFNLVKTNPNISFFFAGPYTESNLSRGSERSKFLNDTINKKNTFFLGSIKQAQIHSFLSQMDVLLLAYKTENNKEQLAYPHKMLEYLASGKTIISSWTEEFANETDLLAMVEDNKQFPKVFHRVTTKLRIWNSKVNIKKRIEYAMKKTYQTQINKIEKKIASIPESK